MEEAERKVYQPYVFTDWRDSVGFQTELKVGIATGLSHGDGDELIREWGSFYTPRGDKWFSDKDDAVKAMIDVLYARIGKIRAQIDLLRTQFINGTYEETAA